MNIPLGVLAAVVSVAAVYLPTRTQAFTHVTVDGRSIRMLVAGSGAATVVFENGLGASLEMWGKVQPAVSRFAKTVSYDRTAPRQDGHRTAIELHRALQAAGVVPPYILVGASLGGPFIRVFADMFPGDVAGMVLVDPTPHTDEARASRVPGGIPVFLIDAVSPVDVPFASEGIQVLRRRNRPEIEADSLEYKRWLDEIPGSRLVVTHRSGHNVPIEQPDLVVETIRQAVDEVTR